MRIPTEMLHDPRANATRKFYVVMISPETAYAIANEWAEMDGDSAKTTRYILGGEYMDGTALYCESPAEAAFITKARDSLEAADMPDTMSAYTGRDAAYAGEAARATANKTARAAARNAAKGPTIHLISETRYAFTRNIGHFRAVARYAGLKVKVEKAVMVSTGKRCWTMDFAKATDRIEFKETVIGLANGTLTGNAMIDAINKINRECGGHVAPYDINGRHA